MPFDWRSDIIARIEWRSIQCVNQPDLVFVDDHRPEKLNCEQTRVDAAGVLRIRGDQNAVCARGQYFNLRTSLPSRIDELLGILKIAMTLDRLAQQPARIELRA